MEEVLVDLVFAWPVGQRFDLLPSTVTVYKYEAVTRNLYRR